MSMAYQEVYDFPREMIEKTRSTMDESINTLKSALSPVLTGIALKQGVPADKV